MKYAFPCLWIVFTTCQPLTAQDRLSGHFLPRFLVNGDFTQRLHWTISVEPDLIWLRKTEALPAEGGLAPFIINGESGLDYQLTTSLNLAAGYLIGWRNLDAEATDLEHRLLQQLTLTQSLAKYRLRWRLRSEQRFFRQNDFQVVHRLRSRLGLDFPLQGERLDPGEPYLHLNAEWLVNPESAQPAYYSERRFYSGLGWRLRSGLRLENGMEWRSRLVRPPGDFRHTLQWRMTLTI